MTIEKQRILNKNCIIIQLNTIYINANLIFLVFKFSKYMCKHFIRGLMFETNNSVYLYCITA